jgi:RNA polymerase sigma-70 factor (ECF subfamily)
MAVTTESLYEQTLVIRSQLGDEAAFAELVERHGPRLLWFTQQMMQSSPDSVADVMQDTWLAIYRGLPRLLDASRFRPWTFRIARDRIYREYRRRKMSGLDDARLTEAEPPEPESGIDREQLHRCLSLISPAHREVLVLRFFEDLSYEEIARITSASPGTVRSRIHYGKQALKHAWQRQTL